MSAQRYSLISQQVPVQHSFCLCILNESYIQDKRLFYGSPFPPIICCHLCMSCAWPLTWPTMWLVLWPDPLLCSTLFHHILWRWGTATYLTCSPSTHCFTSLHFLPQLVSNAVLGIKSSCAWFSIEACSPRNLDKETHLETCTREHSHPLNALEAPKFPQRNLPI